MIANTELPPKACGYHNHFGIDIGRGNTKALHTNLMKLTQTPLLWTLIAKHRARIPKPLHLLIIQQAILQAGTHTASRTLWTQGQTFTIAIIKGIHFFFNNIGHLTDRAFEQLCFLKNRKTYLLIAIATQHRTNGRLKILPKRGICR